MKHGYFVFILTSYDFATHTHIISLCICIHVYIENVYISYWSLFVQSCKILPQFVIGGWFVTFKSSNYKSKGLEYQRRVVG